MMLELQSVTEGSKTFPVDAVTMQFGCSVIATGRCGLHFGGYRGVCGKAVVQKA